MKCTGVKLKSVAIPPPHCFPRVLQQNSQPSPEPTSIVCAHKTTYYAITIMDLEQTTN